LKILILGGGPCGLGAAWRLSEMGHEDWILAEKSDTWGGLSASFRDEEGFWWDLGGHVLFSHYAYFDRVMDAVLGAESGWLFHRRAAWIWMQNRFVPYPLQNHIHHLPKEVFWECLEGIIDLHQKGARPPENFDDWILATFGEGLAKWFLRPYNRKVWAYPPETMDWSWVGERVAPVDLKAVLRGALFEDEESAGWGPNAFFRFPREGGTGRIWREMAGRLPAEKLTLNKKLVRLNPSEKVAVFSDGTEETYDALVSTIPLTRLLESVAPNGKEGFPDPGPLRHSATHVVGLGLNGPVEAHLADKCWMYFPEDNAPFYRVTVFSNYSPQNVPDIRRQSSLMLEVSESPAKPVDRERLADSVIDGALATGLIRHRSQVNHVWRRRLPMGYPTPGLERNAILFPLLTGLAEKGIYSRGRFGAWRYEVGNMDHSFMQGVEWANRILGDGEELTLWYPEVVNRLHPAGMKR
jgi:protoporphyrinogen oxidase